MPVFELFSALLIRLLAVVPFVLLFWWLRRSAGKECPRENGRTLEFSLSPRFRVLLRIVTLALTAFSFLLLTYTLHSGGLYAVLIPVFVLIAILVASPGQVTLDDSGIRQHRRFGVDREIGWAEIASIKRGPRTGATYVKSKGGGRPISFSPLLVGQTRFESEVRARGWRRKRQRRLAHPPIRAFRLRCYDKISI